MPNLIMLKRPRCKNVIIMTNDQSVQATNKGYSTKHKEFDNNSPTLVPIEQLNYTCYMMTFYHLIPITVKG